MKYLRTYEGIDKLQIGDYVICKSLSDSGDNIELLGQIWRDRREFFRSNIGEFVEYDSDVIFSYGIKYENIPKDINVEFFTDTGSDDIIWLLRKEILEYSKNSEDLEFFINANKYNL